MAGSDTAPIRSRRAWVVLNLLLAGEAITGIAALIPLTQAFFHQGNDLMTQKVSIFLAALLAVVWVVVTFIGAAKRRASWARGSAITLHVLLFAAGTGVLQYELAEVWVGWLVILVAFIGFFAALMSSPDNPSDGGADDASVSA